MSTQHDDPDLYLADDESDEASDWPPPYRDGKVHVLSEKCSTCVFKPGNVMNLNPGRLAEMAAHVKETGVPFSCHQTLAYSDPFYTEQVDGMALCHGAVEAYGDQSTIVRMAHAMDVIEEVAPPQAKPGFGERP